MNVPGPLNFGVNGAIVFTQGVVVSDVRAKRDIVPVARLDNGIGLYRYRYNWSDQLYVGVVAQEVAEVLPGAVVRGADGYLRVDYRQLGTHLQTWDEWMLSHPESSLIPDPAPDWFAG